MPAGDPRPLLDRIRRQIRDEGPISFARFMELALYDPQGGFYAGGAQRLGPAGDYVTASDVGRALGRCVARQVREIDRLLGPLDPFALIEFGCGRGLLALDVLQALDEIDPPLAGRLRYVMVDRSESMRREAARRVPAARVIAPEELDGGHRGCAIAVELFDALPVHRVRRRDGQLVEIHVDLDAAGTLVEVELPAGEEVARLARRYGAAAREGSAAEVAAGLAAQLDAMERSLARGVLIIVDYGYPAEQLYHPARARGTLLAYHRHATHERFLERVGEQDLTAHVNFSALEDRARERGLTVLGCTTQDRFLIGNGILEAFDPPPTGGRPSAAGVKRRLQALQLIHPSGMGRVFKVLLLAKGCAAAPRLSGLSDPFARPAP